MPSLDAAAQRRKAEGMVREDIQMLLGILSPICSDPLEHASVILQGKTNFRNTLNKMLNEQANACVQWKSRGIDTDFTRAVHRICVHLGRDQILEAAWNLFTKSCWTATLAQISQDLGYPRGAGLPLSTTPDMVARYYWQTGDEQVPADQKEMIVTSSLNEHDHAKVWKGSAREMKGTYREIMAQSKLADERTEIHTVPGSDKVELVER